LYLVGDLFEFEVKLDLLPERPTVIMVFEKSVEVNMRILEKDGENFMMRRDALVNRSN
jgi:hypothetical protein